MHIFITILIWLIVAAVFYGIMNMLPVPAPVKQIAMAVAALAFLLGLLNAVGVLGLPIILR